MPEFRVDVADRETGRESTIAVLAADASDAEDRAQKMGYLVSHVAPFPVGGSPSNSTELQDHSQPPVSPSGATTAVARGATGSTWLVGALLVAALCILVAGWVSDASGAEERQRRWRDHVTRGDRFKGDNAYGATANGVEDLVSLNLATMAQNEVLLASARRTQLLLVCCAALVAARARRG
ncbi:hypothetical protein PHYC_00499 [Phycisphaerales bacterium]|nr:hypothetical protein PHYC_00499 [Phycisphaerales bacterium]